MNKNVDLSKMPQDTLETYNKFYDEAITAAINFNDTLTKFIYICGDKTKITAAQIQDMIHNFNALAGIEQNEILCEMGKRKQAEKSDDIEFINID